MSGECSCVNFGNGDLRNWMFKAACPVHSIEIFWPPPPKQVAPIRTACGDCYFWMKSRSCPKEKNINGYSRGPSMNGLICEKFERRPVIAALNKEP